MSSHERLSLLSNSENVARDSSRTGRVEARRGMRRCRGRQAHRPALTVLVGDDATSQAYSVSVRGAGYRMGTPADLKESARTPGPGAVKPRSQGSSIS